MKNQLFVLALLCVAVGLYNCSGSKTSEEKEAETATETAANSMEQAAKEMQKAAEEMAGGGEKLPIVNFRDLKALLPESLAGMSRTEYEGEKVGMGGFEMANAKATYEKDDARVRVNISDTGGMGMAMMGLAAWASVSIDKETADGYERTSTIGGHKSFERYNRSSKDGELNVIVNKRFIVSVNGDNIEEKDLKNVLDGIDLDELAKLK